MKYGDKIIKMEGVIVEIRDSIIAIDLNENGDCRIST